MLRSSGPGQVRRSLVANRVLAIRQVQWIGWVFETHWQERKKDTCIVSPQSSERAYVNSSDSRSGFDSLLRVTWIAGVSLSQALPGFLITAPPSVCVPAVLGALAVWIQNHLEYSLGVGLRVTIGGLGLQPTNILREAVSQRSHAQWDCDSCILD